MKISRYFDARSIFTENRLQVEELLRQRAKSFDEKTAKRASAAAAPLAAWVIANVKYSKILEKIRPLELEQTKLQQYVSNNVKLFHEVTVIDNETCSGISGNSSNLKMKYYC